MALRSDYITSQNLHYYDDVLSPALGTSVWQQFYNLAEACDPGFAFTVNDEFDSLSAGTAGTTKWNIVTSGGGTVALVSSGLGGQIQVPTAASSTNDYQALFTQQPIFLPAANKPIAFEFAVNVTEASTNKASWWCGLSSTTSAGFLATTGLPPASYSGAVFYKTKNALAVNFQTSNVTTQNTTSTLFTAVSAQTYLLGAIINPNDGVTALVTPFVSTVVSGVRSSVVIGSAVNLTIASLSKMYLGFGIITSSASAYDGA